MARVAVVFTGGTISMRHDPGAGGNLPAMRGDELLASVPGLAEIAEIEPIDWGLVPASHLSFDQVLDIGRLIADRLAQPEIDGVVVVQGTDVIEETAFAWDLLPLPAKPIVVVGAMRSASQDAYDGPENLRNAVAAAADPLMAEQGVVVAMAGELHGADDVRKTHTHAHAAFQSPNAGRVGLVADGRVTLLRRRSPVRLAHIPERASLPVPILGVALDARPSLPGPDARGPGGGGSGRWQYAAGIPRARTTAHRWWHAGGAHHALPVRPGDAGLRVSRRQLAVVGGRRHLLRHARPPEGTRAGGTRRRGRHIGRGIGRDVRRVRRRALGRT